MISNYTISSLKGLKELPNLNIAQFSLNSRVFPSKRKTVSLLSELSPYHDTKIIVHYDYIYIISRYRYFNDSLKRAIVKEVADIIHYASSDSMILGVVMHTDFPLQKKCYNSKVLLPIEDAYQSSAWDVDILKDSFHDLDSFLSKSLDSFYSDFMNYWYIMFGNEPIKCKVYLENTTRVGPNNQGSLPYLVDYLSNNLDKSNLYGLCYDTEHDFAVTGDVVSVDKLRYLKDKFDLIVHLNCIPEGVAPGSLKDKHSFTTIKECSALEWTEYESIARFMDTENIPYVREVKESIMLKEMSYGH